MGQAMRLITSKRLTSVSWDWQGSQSQHSLRLEWPQVKYHYYIVYTFSAGGTDWGYASCEVSTERPITDTDYIRELGELILKDRPGLGVICIINWILLRTEKK